MSDPLPTPGFNPTYLVPPTNIAGGHEGTESSRLDGTGKVPAARQLPAMPSVPSRESHHLLPTPDRIDAGLAAATLEAPQFLKAFFYTSRRNA
jgi:hypothetical protein